MGITRKQNWNNIGQKGTVKLILLPKIKPTILRPFLGASGILPAQLSSSRNIYDVIVEYSISVTTYVNMRTPPEAKGKSTNGVKYDWVGESQEDTGDSDKTSISEDPSTIQYPLPNTKHSNPRLLRRAIIISIITHLSGSIITVWGTRWRESLGSVSSSHLFFIEHTAKLLHLDSPEEPTK